MRVRTTAYGVTELHIEQYAYGKSTAIQLYGASGSAYPGEHIATLTVYIPECELGPDEVLVKTWSENEQIAADCLASGLFEDTGKRFPTGYVEAQVWRMKPCPNPPTKRQTRLRR